ncbi:hypothetical protein ACJIZ3_005761 [Penstemon smallii]|uniref:MIP18 family-like domain-containing protein n=1 Tax=Penstemon smallii TaxID=265156 RepID=A0ABD3S5W0_9LAMI
MFTRHIRDIKDPENPYSLEELKVITEDAIEEDNKRSHVRVTFIATVEHCSMATVIGLCLRVKRMCCLSPRYKKHGNGCTAYEQMPSVVFFNKGINKNMKLEKRRRKPNIE